MRLRASASIAALWSTPTARTARGASNSSMRPVPVPRSSRLRNGFSPEHGDERGLDPLLGGVQGADAVPVRWPDRRNRPRPACAALSRTTSSRARSAASTGSAGIEPPDEVAGELAARSARRKNAQAPSRWRDCEPRLGQELQVARHARLRLAEDGDEFADRELGLVEQAEDPQPRLLARRLEAREQCREGRMRSGGARFCR